MFGYITWVMEICESVQVQYKLTWETSDWNVWWYFHRHCTHYFTNDIRSKTKI